MSPPDGVLKKGESTWRARWRAYLFFLRVIWRSNPWLVFAREAFVVLQALLQPAEVYVFSLLIAAITAQDAPRIQWLLLVVICVSAGRIIFGGLAASKMEDWFIKNSELSFRHLIFDHLNTLDPESLMREHVRRDIDFVREDMWRLYNVPSQTEALLRSLVRLVGAFALAFVAPWWVSVVVVISSALTAWVQGNEARRDIWDASWNSLDGRRVEYVRWLFLSGEDFRELRLLDGATTWLRKTRVSAKRILQRFRATAIKSLMQRFGLSLVNVVAYGAVIVIIGTHAVNRPGDVAVLYIALNLFGLLGEALSGISSSVSSLWANVSILVPILDLLHTPSESQEGLHVPKGPLRIVFQNVSYRYPGAKRDALQHVSVTIAEGEHLAVVGENGAGKSTFLRLLAGLDRPTHGKILVNDVPLEEYQKGEWRRAFHLMLQGAKLYQDFIEDNLRAGEPTGRWKEHGLTVSQSTTIAGADSVIREVPNGLKTFIGDWAAPPGVDPYHVSGGQQQRLLIARTLVHGGRIVGFDEPTSAMDALAETSFFERLHESMRGHGLIFISHRFSTVRRAARILVFHNGQLIEDGPHDTLLARSGQYARLYEEQARWYA